MSGPGGSAGVWIVAEFSSRKTVHKRHPRGRGSWCGAYMSTEKRAGPIARPLCRKCFSGRMKT